MDELSFRRTIYAEPNTTDPDIIQAAKDDPAKQVFWDEVKAMDAQLAQAMSIPVPENFADKLILRQGMDEFSQKRQKRPWYIALAASVAMVVGVSYVTLFAGNNGLANDIYAHINHEYMNKEIAMTGQHVSQNVINEKMATFNGVLSGEIGDVLSANYCYLGTKRQNRTD
jgi:secreted PhoX family phosphatase